MANEAMKHDFTVLPNGLRVIGVPMKMFRSVSVGLWVDSGSVYETAQTNGISHFIEHMLFKGTENRTARQIAEEMDAVGGLLNAFTDRENTCFYTKVVDEHLPLAMDMISDLVLHSRLAKEDIAREKGVVLEEINMAEDTPDDLVFELLAQARYGLQPVSRPVLGTAENVNAFTCEDILAHMKRCYRPEGAVLALAGSYDWDKVVSQAAELYGAWQGTGEKRPVIALEPHEPTVIRREKDIEQTHITIDYPGLKAGDPAYYPLTILNTVVGGAMSSRLFQTIREEKGLAYSVYSGTGATSVSGTFEIYAGTSPENAEQVVELINREMLKLAKDGISEKEFSQAREQTLANLIMATESTSNRMQSAGRRMLMRGETMTPDELIEKVKAIRPEEVNELASGLINKPRAAALVGAGTDNVSDALLLMK